MANLYANVCHVARPGDLGDCLDMVTTRAARLMRLSDYGLHVGAVADLVLLDATDGPEAVAELAAPLWGMKAGRLSFSRARRSCTGQAIIRTQLTLNRRAPKPARRAQNHPPCHRP